MHGKVLFLNVSLLFIRMMIDILTVFIHIIKFGLYTLPKGNKKWISILHRDERFRKGFTFGWVGFYGISTIVGYLMPNPLYTYILNIYDLVW